ncbi:MAG: peptidyl-prolyl cis-trans isomerase [Flavobacteriaceae bacterium]|nr:peptidyl-prolyl cis-trans isomerase [Flavobacteriaceae bacterium]MDG1091700.1 peptidyl-prolyl cis-trans isomerase [Flavobacteriaceae bacterium]
MQKASQFIRSKVQPLFLYWIGAVTFLFFFVSGCDQLYSEQQDVVVARAGNSYLYRSELRENITVFSSKTDSIIQSENYINNWARKQLLFDQAIINLEIETQKELDELVNSYRSDLWSRSYKEFIVKSNIDTVISKAEVETFYQENQNNFRLNEIMVNLRYIALPSENIDLLEIKNKLIRFQEEDVRFLDSLTFQFNSYELKDSLWLAKRELIRTLPIINEDNFEDYLKKSQFFLIEDAFEVYLLFVNDYILRNEVAPLVSVENTIRKIVFNKRKLDFIKQFDKEILQDAIQTKKFQLYR